jgi:hypothetical protein
MTIIRRLSQTTDRGNIKDLAHPRKMEVGLDKDLLFTSTELRFKKLYEYAQTYKDKKLQQALGIITTDYIADKNALPLSIYRLKQVIEDIKSKSGGEIIRLEGLFSKHLSRGISDDTVIYLSRKKRIKTATICKPPVFRRVSND